MKLAKRLLVVLFVVAFVGPLVGCGVGNTTSDTNRSIRRVADLDARMMVDDLGNFTQLNRPLHTSRHPIR
jgi:nitrite reductase (NADH) small subunit